MEEVAQYNPHSVPESEASSSLIFISWVKMKPRILLAGFCCPLDFQGREDLWSDHCLVVSVQNVESLRVRRTIARNYSI
jgi:hypothetical protein